MGLEKIKQEIVDKALQAEKEIIAEALKAVDKIKKEASEKAKRLKEEAANRLKSELQTLENRERSIQNMESQKLMFEAKKELMEKAYNEAVDKIEKMPKKEREEIMKSLLKRAKGEIDVKVVYAHAEDKSIIGSSFELKDLYSHGIICENEDGTVRVDYTFHSLFEEVKENTVKKASEILFG
jgi:V/A-type H+/Na+-transporting ATPase subunit E